MHANRSSQGFNESGKFSYQLILDNGAEEALIMPTVDDAKVLRDLIHDAGTLYWNLDKQTVVFGRISRRNISLEGEVPRMAHPLCFSEA